MSQICFWEILTFFCSGKTTSKPIAMIEYLLKWRGLFQGKKYVPSAFQKCEKDKILPKLPACMFSILSAFTNGSKRRRNVPFAKALLMLYEGLTNQNIFFLAVNLLTSLKHLKIHYFGLNSSIDILYFADGRPLQIDA